ERREEDEPLHARALGGVQQAQRGDPVQLLDRGARLVPDRRGQVHDRVHAPQRVAKRARLRQVAEGDLDPDALGPEAPRIAHEADYDEVEMLYIDPDECIDCDACVEACPVDACFAEDQLPDEWQKYTELNAQYYKSTS